jgi:2'-5' RNA ligase
MTERGETAPPKTHRLFFASWPGEERRLQLERKLRNVAWASGGRRVAASHYHLTFAFLGSVRADRLEAITAAAGALRAAAFDLCLDQLEYFPKARVLCLSESSPNEAAQNLVRALWQKLAALGFKPEVRPFKAHLTIARKVERPPRERSVAAVDWRVDALSLVESVTAPEGSVYTPLAAWPLISSST